MPGKKYFDNFPKIDYRLSKNETKKSVDILRRAAISETVLNDDRNLISGFVKDGTTPEDLAEKTYGNRDYYWVILLSAKIHNPYYGWPLEYSQLLERTEKQYPGISLFVSSTYGSMNTKSKSVNFSISDTIEVLDGEGNIKFTGTIYDYDLTSGQMKLNLTSGDPTFTIGTEDGFIVRSTTDSSKTGFVRRKFNDVKYSLYGFRDSTTKRVYGPLHRYLPSDEKTLIETYTNTNNPINSTGEVSSSNPILTQGITILTNYDYEQELNDRNRFIKILKPSLLQKVVNEIKFTLRN